MTAAEPLDPERLAAILAEHERHWQSHGSTLCLGGREYADAEHCLPYRLAAEVERLQAQDGVDADYWQRRAAEKALREAGEAAEQEFQLPREFGFEIRRFLDERADPYRSPQPSPDAA